MAGIQAPEPHYGTEIQRLHEAASPAGVKVSPAVLEALRHCLTSGTYSHADKYRHENRTPLTLRTGSVTRHPEHFVFPHLAQRRQDINRDTQAMCRALAESILIYAQEEMKRQIEEKKIPPLSTLDGGSVSNTRTTYAMVGGNEYIYFDVDTTRGTETEITARVANVVNAIKDKFMAIVEVMLSNQRIMAQIYQTVGVETAINTKIVLEAETQRLESLRLSVERPEDAQQFFKLLNEAVKILGYDDVTVRALNTRDALHRNADGLYSRATVDNPNATIHLPMSHYGTTSLRELDNVLEILAHELAHHDVQMAEWNKIDGGDSTHAADHGMSHTALTQRNLNELRKLEFAVDPKTGEIRVKKGETPTITNESLKVMIETAFRESIAALRDETREGFKVQAEEAVGNAINSTTLPARMTAIADARIKHNRWGRIFLRFMSNEPK